MSVGIRLKKLREESELKQESLAAKLGINRSTISMYERDQRMPSPDVLKKYADIFDVSLDYILGKSKKRNAESDSQKYEVPVFYAVACGNPFVADEDIIDWEEIDPKLKSQGEHFGVKLRGDSMLPDFKDGDVVIVRQQSDIDSGSIAIVRVNGDEATMKIVQKSKDGITLIATNPSVYLPKFYSNQDIEQLPVSIIGKVIEQRRKL